MDEAISYDISYDRRLGGAQPGNRFVSFVRAYSRSGCPVEWDLKNGRPPPFPFPSLPRGAFPFPFGGDELSLFPSPNRPNLLSNFSWAYRYSKNPATLHKCCF